MDTEYAVTLTAVQVNTALKLIDVAVKAIGLNACADALEIAKALQDAVKPKED